MADQHSTSLIGELSAALLAAAREVESRLGEYEIDPPELRQWRDLATVAAGPRNTATSQDPQQLAREALEATRQFIRNGVELGYIRMPDHDCLDAAHEALPRIDRALAALATVDATETQEQDPQQFAFLLRQIRDSIREHIQKELRPGNPMLRFWRASIDEALATGQSAEPRQVMDVAPGLFDAPCLWCGYDGEGYWQPGTHATHCPWHEVGGRTERRLALGAWIMQATGRAAEATEPRTASQALLYHDRNRRLGWEQEPDRGARP